MKDVREIFEKSCEINRQNGFQTGTRFHGDNELSERALEDVVGGTNDSQGTIITVGMIIVYKTSSGGYHAGEVTAIYKENGTYSYQVKRVEACDRSAPENIKVQHSQVVIL